MKRQINYLRHLAVFVLTIIIFALGIFIGGDLEQARVQNLYTQLQEQDLELQNVIAESNYIDYLVSSKESGENVSCQTLKGAYHTSISNLDDSRLKLENYINVAQVKEDEYQRLREHYSNLQINYYILANKISGLCESEMNTILYFYSEEKKDCPSCEDQGIHLSYVKQRMKEDILIFSLNADTTKGPANLLKQNFDVSSRELPVLVINDEVYGFLDNEEIFEVLNYTEE